MHIVACIVVLAACTDRKESRGGGAGGEGGDGTPLCIPPEVEHEGACVLTGTPPDACAEGFAAIPGGGCAPILPAEACADGMMATFGEATCRPIIACGDDTWANIPDEPTTEYVDPAYAGNDSDGSRDKPWTDPEDAVSAADDGDIIAFAAADYGSPPNTLNKSLRFIGRCPELVRFTATAVGDAFFLNTPGVELRQLSITGVDSPIIAADAEGVVIDSVWVHDTDDVGILVTSTTLPTSATIRNTLVERAGSLGIVVVGADVEIHESEVRDVLGNALGPGRGIDIEHDPVTEHAPTVLISRTLVAGAREVAMACLGATCTIAESAFIDTRPQADGRFGMGLAVQFSEQPATAILRGSYIGRVRMFGVSVVNSSLSLVDSTIDGVDRQQNADDFGDGVAVITGSTEALSVSTDLSRGHIRGVARAGIASFSASVSVNRMSLECNAIDLDGENVSEMPHDFSSVGPSACWCGEAVEPCKVLESQLEPPALP